MADVSHLITKGIGTPADIAHFTLFGLSPTGVVVAVTVVELTGTVSITRTLAADVDVTRTLAGTVRVTRTLTGDVDLQRP